MIAMLRMSSRFISERSVVASTSAPCQSPAPPETAQGWWTRSSRTLAALPEQGPLPLSRSSLDSTRITVDAEDVADALQAREDARELLDARHLQRRVHRRTPIGIRGGRQRDELHLVLADHRRHIAQEPVAVPALDADSHRVRARDGLLPLDLDEALRVGARLHVRAVS